MTAPIVRMSIFAFAVMILAPSAHASYSLVWSDEFNGTELDTSNWSYDIGNGCPDLCGWGNNELQYYRAENVAVTGGNLVISARDQRYQGYDYTSGKITTRDKHVFRYGRIEMRAKLPKGGGMWPAFWMMPNDDVYGGWAASGELDIMESSNAMDYINGTIHYGGSYPQNTYSGGTYAPGGSDFSADFRVYAVEWEPDEIRWYVDDVLYVTKTSAEWYTNAAPGNPRAPFDQDFYVLLNAAVGGNYTGCNDPGCITASFPQEYLIDYVRVYEDIPNELPSVAITAPEPGSVLPAGDVDIAVSAGDTDGTIQVVEFYEGSSLLGTDSSAPYAFTWADVADGCYEIVARVIDDLGGTAEVSVDVTVGDGCGQAPFVGSAPTLPARIQAEDYDEGGPGVAYEDADPSNNGGAYRPAEQVDVEATTDVGGGYNVGWVQPGEWTEYTVVAPVTGTYGMRARVASLSAGGSFRLDFDGIDRTGTVVVPVTGGWQTWVDVDFEVALDAGTYVMRFVPLVGEYNVNWFEAVQAPTSAPSARSARTIDAVDARPNPFNPSTTIRYTLLRDARIGLNVFDARGRHVRTLLDGGARAIGTHETPWNGRDDGGRIVAGGVYYARLDAGEESRVVRLVLLK